MWFDRVVSFFSWLESETQKLHSVNFWSNRQKAPKSNLLSLKKFHRKEQLVRSNHAFCTFWQSFYFNWLSLYESMSLPWKTYAFVRSMFPRFNIKRRLQLDWLLSDSCAPTRSNSFIRCKKSENGSDTSSKINPISGASIIWNSNVKFVLHISNLIMSPKGLLSWPWNSFLQKPMPRLWFHFKRPFFQKISLEKVVWPLMLSDQVRAPSLGSERTRTSDVMKVKVWSKFILLLEMLLWRRKTSRDWT